jgi:hypothetical protein
LSFSATRRARYARWGPEKGVSGSLYLHFLDGDFAVFPAEKRVDKADAA